MIGEILIATSYIYCTELSAAIKFHNQQLIFVLCFPYIKLAIAQKALQQNADVLALILCQERSQVASS